MRRLAAAALLAVFIGACAHLPEQREQAPPQVKSLHGARIIAITPTRRWQALLDWQSGTASGWVRITHPATGTTIELRWQGDEVLLRSTQHPHWRAMGAAELARWGWVLPPADVAAFLLGRPPKDAERTARGWRIRRGKEVIFVRWIAKRRAWRFEDRRHGRLAEVRLP